jgi:hypothetical protein
LNRDVEITEELIEDLRAHVAIVRSYFERRKRPVPPMLLPSTDGTYLDVRNMRKRKPVSPLESNGGPSRTRTSDPLIINPGFHNLLIFLNLLRYNEFKFSDLSQL